MKTRPCCFSLALLGLVGSITLRPLHASPPGGRFEQRLDTVETKLRPPAPRPRKPAPRTAQVRKTVRTPARTAARPAARVPSRNRVRAASRVVNLRRPVTVRAQRPARRASSIRMASHRGAAPRAHPRVTYSVKRRSASSHGHEITGDLVLFANSNGSPVEYRWEGGSREARGAVVLKGLLAQPVQVAAAARGRGETGWTWVPVRPNCITTVRFNLPR